MMLTEKGYENPNPRRQFFEDLTNYIRDMELSENDFLLVYMDANNTSDRTDVIKEFCQTCDLVDIYEEKHGDTRQFPTHENGSVKIDFLLGSTNIMEYIDKVGYIGFHEAFDSDHRDVYCDLSKRIMSRTRAPTDTMIRLVGTNSTNTEGTNYVQFIDHNFKQHKIYEKIDTILQSTTIVDEINQ
jgi:hypothetical protein